MALGIPMALLYGSLASGGLSALGSMLGGGGDVEQGYDIYTPPEYEWSPGLLSNEAAYLQNELANLQSGALPSWLTNAIAQSRDYYGQSLQDQYYGRAGERNGIYNQAEALGARTGVGAKSTFAQVGKAQQDYLNSNSQIDNYLATLIPGYMQNQQGTILSGIQGMPRTREYSIINNMGGVTQGGGMGSAIASGIGGLMSSIPWESMGGSTGAENGVAAGNILNSFQSGEFGLSSPTSFGSPTSYKPFTSASFGL